MLNRYLRQIAIPNWGESGQQKLAQSRVLVVGAGGLGFPLLSYLSAAGVGNIILFESDSVAESNLNRQLFYTESDIGKRKIDVTMQRLSDMNPNVSIIPVAERFTEETAVEYIQDIDVLVDCVDNYDTRIVMAKMAHRFGKPMIHGAVSDFLGTVAVFDSRNGPCFRCVYEENPAIGMIPVFGALPGMVGSMQAVETIKILTGIGKTPFHKILLIDMEHGIFHYAEIEKNKDCPVCIYE